MACVRLVRLFRFMRRIVTISLLLAAASILQAQTDPDIKVLVETPTSLTVEFSPRYISRSVTGTDGRKYILYEFEGAATEEGAPGSPLVQYKPLLVNLPSREFSLTILQHEFDYVPNASAASLPSWRSNKDFGLMPVYGSPAMRYQGGERIPGQAAKVTDVGEARGLLLGTLRLYPVQQDPAANEVRLARRLVVRLDFRGSGRALPPSLFLKRSFPLNLTQGTVSVDRTLAEGTPLATGDWYRMEIKETGIYKIDQDLLSKAGISLSAVGNINSVRIFGNGGEELPEDLNASRPKGLEEVSRLVVDKNGNGAFDSDDFVLFYGRSTRRWKYVPLERTFRHYINHYTETNVYFLTFGGSGRGKDMPAEPSTTVSGAYKPSDFKGRLFVENELDNLVKSGRQWVGESFDISRNVNTFTNLLPGFVATKPTVYRFEFLTRSESVDTFRVQENGQSLGYPVETYTTDVSSIVDKRAYQTPVISFERTGTVPNDRSVLRIQFGTRNNAAQGWLDWFEILYPRRHEADNDLLLFSSPDTNAVVEYMLSKFSSRDTYVFDVSDHGSVRQVTNLAFDAADVSVVRFQLTQTSGSVRELAAVGAKGFKSPTSVKRVTNSNLHGQTGADFVILAPTELQGEAGRLKAHREKSDGLSTLVVNIEQLYNEFSSGMLDPVAIRDFLKYTQTTWTTKPKYVLLFGAGTYDYKKIKFPDAINWVPPYETLESNVQVLTLATDDFFVMLDPSSQRVSLPLGRLPVRSVDTAKYVVDKIIAYETTALYDSWRNRITYVADDGLTSTGDDGTIHTDQSERLAKDYTPNSFTKEKIFIVQYPTVNTSTGRRKPSANVAIVQAINQGTVILNYTGHGNTDVWAHEWVFVADQDFALLNNKGKPFFLVAATCDFARYDNPEEISAGEQLLFMPERGAIAEVTADRVVYSDQNALLNWTVYQNLLHMDSTGKPMRLGDAMWLTKQVLYTTNDLKHHLLGDPTMRLAVPRGNLTIDTLNGQPVSSLVTVNALGKVLVKGSLRNAAGVPSGSIQGRALLEMYDSKRKVLVPEWGDYSFEVNGSLIYRGEVSVRNGQVQGLFPIPKDVSYGNDRSRISLYAWSDSIDAAGYTENLTIAGSVSGEVDTVGPNIQLFLEDRSFRPGDIVGPNAMLIVDLTDSSGINTSTAAIGHRLEAAIDGSTRPIDLTEYYRGNLDTYQSGQVNYQFLGLTEGRHTLEVKAWDVYNNSATAETFFEVRTSEDLAIYNAVNVPNPFARSTTFTFQRSSTEPIDIDIKVYTVAGRLIQTIEMPSVTDRVARIPWDGRDRDGSEIANGVYLYKITTRSIDRTSTNEVIGKLAVLR